MFRVYGLGFRVQGPWLRGGEFPVLQGSQEMADFSHEPTFRVQGVGFQTL